MRLPACFAIILALVSCSKNPDDKEAIRQAVIQHLQQRKGLDLDLSAMDLTVSAVSIRQNDADATVSFQPKGMPGGGMTMQYQLERSGGQWKVKPRAPGMSGGHGQPPAAGSPNLPPDHPPMGSGQPPATESPKPAESPKQ